MHLPCRLVFSRNAKHLARLLALAAATWSLAACSDGAGQAGADTAAEFDLGGSIDLGAIGDQVDPADSGPDASASDQDAAISDGNSEPEAGDDAGGGEVGKDSGEPLCPGGAGCECQANSECDAQVCIDHPNGSSATGKICAQVCTDTCVEPGFQCATISVGGDPISICVPPVPTLCNPCAASKECEALGYKDAACVDQGGLGAFCGVACSGDEGCPSGYACKDVKTVEGAATKQCVRPAEAGSGAGFGVCTCNVVSVKKKLSTACKVAALDDKGNAIGTCVGQRTCGPDGLSACITPGIGKEVCDGLDNDCDGETDIGACDDGKPCTIDACDPQAKQCKSISGADGLDCDADGSACTSGDKCVAGQCIVGGKLDCDDKNPCTEDTCDSKAGCTQKPLDATACEDGNPCTIGDNCKSGQCETGSPKICESGDACVIAKCSIKEGGKCNFDDALEGLPCTDGNACTENDGCKSGSCKGGSLTDCNDGNPCTSDSCDGKAGCVQVNNNKPCDADGNLCTVGDSCVGGTCTAGKATGCDDSNPCTVDSCDGKSGKCAFDGSKAAGVPCNDDDVCTESDACADGGCKGKAKLCDDGNACTTDSCDSKQGCSSTSSNAKCDDGDACSVGDACQGNLCKGAAKTCDDGDPCTLDSCEGKAGCKAVQHQDKFLCGVGKWCVAGKCETSCSDDCVKTGTTSCQGDAMVTCGQFDADLCLDGSTPKACSAFETCKAGACVQKEAPHNIVISELLYDGAGADADAFIELQGPAGAELTGWTLVGIDGVGGKAYNAIDLKGKIPADGYFVVAATNAAKAILDVADQVSAQADYQNGPDSLELRYGAKVVDAVGYGDFKDAVFQGEGLAAPDAENGASIARDAKATDTNDNSKDFKVFLKATPGAENIVPNEVPVVGLKCPASVPVGAKLKLDTSGTSDADGQIVGCALYVNNKLIHKASNCSSLELVLDVAGKQAVLVVATDDKGGEGSQSCTIDVSATNQPPVVALSCPAAVEVGKAAAFDASKSSDADGTIKGYTWTFGDGGAAVSGTSALANHSYVKAGAYEVSVEIVDDKGATAKGSCLIQAKAQNQPPKASLVCPAALIVDTEGTFDASASSDADGTLKSYTFVFSDGSAPSQGTAAKVVRKFSKTGSLTVTLTVVDDAGDEGKADCTLTVSVANPPDVVVVKPAANINVTQGESVQFTVDATGKAGASVAKVSLLFDGQPVGTDTTAPYTFIATIPADAKTGAKIQVVATATDSKGAVGSSAARVLTVVNQVPTASFAAVVSGALEVSVDGTLSTDAETKTEDLEVRWDWNTDGVWDVDWSKVKVLKHKYAKAGSYTLTMEVRDAVGQVASATRKVDLSLLQTVFGNVNTTTWVGTIIVTGNVIVPVGQVLTVAAGTSVQFASVDQDSNGKGDYSITVNGKIVVQGTAGEPVVFTNYGATVAAGKGWDKIVIAGDGSSFAHAVIEYADVGIEAKKKVALTNVVVRKNRVGIVVAAGGQPEGTNSEAVENVEEGVVVGVSGALVWNGGKLSKNGKSGVRAESASASASLQLDGVAVTGNGYVGAEVLGGVSGLITKCTITGNNYEGVRVSHFSGTDPSLSVRLNNIYGNAVVGARVIKDASTSANIGGNSTGTNTSSALTSPAGTTIDLVRWSYSETDPYGYCAGAVRKDNASGSALISASSTSNGLASVSGSKAAALVAQASKSSSSSSYSATMVITTIAYDEPKAKRELTVIRAAGTTDARWNWLGDFPAVLPLVAMSPTTAVNLEGFVGVKFDANWSRGVYHGGETAPNNLVFAGEVYLSGSLVIGAGKSLTLEPGTTVLFVNHDQNGDGKGDFELTVAGALDSNGTANNPVLVTALGGSGKAAQWQRLQVTGSSSKSTISHTTIEHSATGVQLGTGTHTLTSVVLRNSAGDGLGVTAATSVKLAAITSKEHQGNGITVTSSSNFSIDGGTLQNNGGAGLSIKGSNALITVAHVLVTKNKGAGLLFDTATVTVSQSDLTYNDIGALLLGACGGKIQTSSIKFNNHEGLYVNNNASGNPTMSLTQCNLFGNGVSKGGAVLKSAWSVAASGSFSGTQTSPDWKSPDGSPILGYQLGYQENDPYGYCSGSLVRDSASGATLHSFSATSSVTWYHTLADAPLALVGKVNKSSSSLSYNGSLSVPVIYYRKKDSGTEVTVMTNSGTLDFKGNYWGDGGFPNPVPKLALSRTDAADVQGPQPTPVSGTGPLK